MPQAGVELRKFASIIKRSGEVFYEKKLKVISIFATNSLSYSVSSNKESFAPRLTRSIENETGVMMKASKFNFSCRPNAVSEPCRDQNGREVTVVFAITKIKAGQEITIPHLQNPRFSMFPLECRKHILLHECYTTCSCDFCLEQEVVNL